MAVLPCPKRCSPSFLDKEDFRTDHTVTEAKTQDDGSVLWQARCDACGAEEWHLISLKPGTSNPTYKTKWPHYNWSLGKTVESKDHMMHIAKSKGCKPYE